MVLRRATITVLAVVVAVGWWLVWVHLADLVAYRAPYGLWRCRIDNGGAIGDPFLTVGSRLLQLAVLAACFAAVRLAVTGARLRGRPLLYRIGVIVLLVCVVSVAYVLATDAMLHPSYDVPECG